MNKRALGCQRFNRSLLIYTAFVLLFIVPKFFNFYLTSEMYIEWHKWLFIGVTDLLPFVAISLWVWFGVRGDEMRTTYIPKGNDALLTLRFFACLMVIFGHYFGNIFPASSEYSGVNNHVILRLLMSSPWGGVWLFFGLSGYLMGKGFFLHRYPLDSKGIAHYLFNRAMRILPIYIFGVILFSVFLHPSVFNSKSLWILAQNILLDYNGNLPININPVLWSVSTEFQFYLLAPFLAMIIILISARVRLGYWAIIVVIAAGIALRYFFAEQAGWEMDIISTRVYVPIGSNLDLFISGMLLAKIMQQKKPKKAYWHLPVGIVTLAVLFAVLAISASYTAWPMPGILAQKYFTFAPTIALCGVILIIRLLDSWEVKSGWLFPRIVRWTQFGGSLTYCLYVFHYPIMTSLRPIAARDIGLKTQVFYFPLILAMVIFFSAVFYFGIEKPAAKLKQ